MSTEPPPYPPETREAPAPTRRTRNGLGIAALVIGVASLVAAISFILFPVALIGGVVGVVLGIFALMRTSSGEAANPGQSTAGLICSALALIIAIVLTVRVGTWVARNTGVFTRFDRCIAQAGDRAAVSECIARFANEVRP
jgi:hypothetical protein